MEKINRLLPEAKVVTITQIADAQIKVNRLMAKLSLMLLVIIVLVGGASIANYMYANVSERRREIGTLMALGAGSGPGPADVPAARRCCWGSPGGIGGYVAGTLLAVLLGPQMAGVSVLPMPVARPCWAIGISVALALMASYFPARRAARLDPCATFQEV